MRSRVGSVAVPFVLAFAMHGSLAHASGGLIVVPVEGGSWSAQIAALESEPRPPGVAFHVRVLEDDTHRAVPCGQYALALDARGQNAIHVGHCDASTGASEIVLVDRAWLFAPGDPVPVPQPIAVSASAVRIGGEAGGAAPAFGVEFRCVASVRPFVADLLNGTAVYLTPDRYRLEPLDGRVSATALHDGWVVASTRGDAVAEAAFRVVDLHSETEVTRNRVAMRCSVGHARAPITSRVVHGSAALPFRLPAGAVGRGSTVGGESERLACTDAASPTVVWRFTAPEDARMEFVLQGGYAAALEVRGAGAVSLGCERGALRSTHARVVTSVHRGENYDLWVSGDAGDAGAYEVAAIAIEPDVEVSARVPGVRVLAANSER